MTVNVTFESAIELIEAAVDDARGDALVGGMRVREALARHPVLRAAVAEVLLDDAVMRLADEIGGALYPKKPAIAF